MEVLEIGVPLFIRQTDRFWPKAVAQGSFNRGRHASLIDEHHIVGGGAVIGFKTVLHLKMKSFIYLTFKHIKLRRLRNRINCNLLIFKLKIMDCKSAHAGSFSASASAFEIFSYVNVSCRRKEDIFSRQDTK